MILVATFLKQADLEASHSLHAERHSLLETSMTGMGPTTKWREISLVYGQSKSLILLESPLFHTILESSFALCIMEHGSIAFRHGSNMLQWIQRLLQHHMMVYTGNLLLQKGADLFHFVILSSEFVYQLSELTAAQVGQGHVHLLDTDAWKPNTSAHPYIQCYCKICI